MQWLDRISRWIDRAPIWLWLVLVLTQLATIVSANAHLRKSKAIFDRETQPILSEDYIRIVAATALGIIFLGFAALRWRSGNSTSDMRRWKQLLVSLLTPLIVLLSLLPLLEWWQDSRVRNLVGKNAENWVQKARAEAKPTWTEDYAVAWLKQNEFETVRKGEGWHSEVGKPDQHYYLAKGHKKLAKAGPITAAAWLEMTFVFDNNSHRYERVEYSIERERFRREREAGDGTDAQVWK
jgi:hypothetical protein